MSEKYDFTQDSSYRRLKEEKKKKNKVDPVQVHIMKIKDLPDPLNMREFRAVMEHEGHVQVTGLAGVGNEGARWQHAAEIQRQENAHANIFGTYQQIYELFKQWHSGLIAQRAVGPGEASEEAGKQATKAPFMEDIKPQISPEEVQHVLRQQKLVQLLIELVKVGIETGGKTAARARPPYEPASDSELTVLTSNGTSTSDVGTRPQLEQRNIGLGRLAATGEASLDEGEVNYKPQATTIFNQTSRGSGGSPR